ncbi:divergent polysaccharide deacetylase family protein [Shewanella mesophila]|uniref:divergent polysaccharide deacetylase family protein n=1 Tax=Shewanella mesophila TaxID=2864208 RepID=UPI001C656EA4|nr:divergent polysaccharide deacetylase family protein [Shewanella mesophila]QYJ86165.1 divergent polysaccharide deacetylase family protein [Shewanella mesophila]
MRLLLLLAFILIVSPTKAAQVAIIIDDIGYRQTDTAVLSLPSSITLSVLPHTPLGKEIALLANDNGHEIMLHLPMQALNGKKQGPGGLTNKMNEQEFKQTIDSALGSIPNVRGVNNHMGSLLTQMNEQMIWLMESLKQQDTYFVDSATTRYTKAGEMANKLGVPQLKRQIFLDNDVSETALEYQFQRLIKLANNEGQVVVIAHPYPETIRFLQSNLKRLEQQGLTLVKTSQLLPYQLAQKESKVTGSKTHVR